MYQNPSFASLLPVYSWAANFKALPVGRAYSVSVLDGRSELFQASAAYLVRDDFSAVHLGASIKLRDRLTAGVGGKMIFTKNAAITPNGRNFNLSGTYAPWDWLQVSLLADNLLPKPEFEALGMEREIVLGTKFRATDKLIFYVDPHYRVGSEPSAPTTGSPFGYEAGIEVGIFKDFFLRAGRFQQVMHPETRTRSNGFGYGAGWVAPRMSFDYAVERIRSPIDELTHNWGATLYF